MLSILNFNLVKPKNNTLPINKAVEIDVSGGARQPAMRGLFLRLRRITFRFY